MTTGNGKPMKNGEGRAGGSEKEGTSRVLFYARYAGAALFN